MVRTMGYYNQELYHHGILGQKWGVRRFQRKDGTRTAAGKERQAENAKKKGLSDKQKTAIKTALGVTAGLLVAYGGYKLATNPAVKSKMYDLLNGSKEKRMADLSKEIDNLGPEIVRRSDWGYYDAGESMKSGENNPANLSEAVLQMASNKNPFNRTDNCKEVAHAFCESMYSNDSKVIAGKKPRFEGNLFDYCTRKLGWSDNSVLSVSGNTHEQLRNNVTNQINKRFKDGDYGMIGFDRDHKEKQKLISLGLIKEDSKGIDGHAFNWIKEGGVVKFFDCTSNKPVDASNYFNKAELSTETLITCYNVNKAKKS